MSAVLWSGVAALALVSCCWPLAGLAWTLDLIANLNAQWLALGLAWLGVCTIFRRRGAMIGAAIACAMLLLPMCLYRAAWFPASAPAYAITQGPELRILHYNARSVGRMDTHVEMMRQTNADLISLLAPGVAEQFAVIERDALKDQFPGRLTRRWKPSLDGAATMITAAYLVSKWPLIPEPMLDLGEMREHIIAGTLKRPPERGGDVGVIAIHPRSPRSRQRWIEGNLTIDSAGEIARRFASRGLPVVLIADLNSTPSGYRSRHLCAAAGLRRAKPLFAAAGTYPEEWPLGLDVKTAPTAPAPWPTSLAIDDVWISAGLAVRGWEALPALNSEHRPIVVDLSVPPSGIAEK